LLEVFGDTEVKIPLSGLPTRAHAGYRAHQRHASGTRLVRTRWLSSLFWSGAGDVYERIASEEGEELDRLHHRDDTEEYDAAAP
jgi:hypothetical protein